MNRILKYVFGLLFVFAFLGLEAKEPPKKKRKNNHTTVETTYRAQCQKAKRQDDMEINNVRAKLLTGGDLWWDGSNGKYIVPKPKKGSDKPEVSALYAGGIWIGGKDSGGNLKLAASTFPDGDEVDYYTGPLDPDNGTTELQICQDWDRFFEVTGKEIQLHLLNFNSGVYNSDCSLIPPGVKYWPGKGNEFFTEKYNFRLPNTGQGLGAFHDVNGNGDYEPCGGDYPIIEIEGCPQNIYPDDMFFWVYNDQGGPHTESFGKAIQMEVQVQAFAFVSNDEINDMTFYRYKLINRATDDIRDTYFAMWIDPDLGCSSDDYVGCDTTRVSRTDKNGNVQQVGRDLMFVYNEDDQDGEPGISCSGVPTYQEDIPILGIDYFRGPKIPYTYNSEGILLPTKVGESQDTLLEVGMSAFTYYNNAAGGNPPGTQDPDRADEYYNYLTGLWKDGTPFTFGGTGYNPGSTDSTNYVYAGNPGNTQDWSMCSTSAQSGDRRTLQVTGPLLLKPGAKNELIIGAVYVPHIDYPCPDLGKLLYADGLAQALFDECFDRLEGPQAPEMCGIELDKELILVLSNDTSAIHNNAYEAYEEIDIFGKEIPGDSLYHFEGYKIFQLVNQNVSVQELDDIDNARLVRQVDVKNGVNKIYNWTSINNPNGSDDIWTPLLKVEGADQGIQHTFQITEDAFASGDNRLINHKNYYYLVLAYAYNEKNEVFNGTNLGQRTSYIEGVKTWDGSELKVLTMTPRPIVYENLNAKYGDGAVITRIHGEGVGGNEVEMADNMHELILSENFDGRVVYKDGKGPITVKIFDPRNVKDGKYTIELVGDFDESKDVCAMSGEATWVLRNDEGVEIASEQSLEKFNEQVLSEIGVTVSIGQVAAVGKSEDEIGKGNGTISGDISFADPEGPLWFVGMLDGGELVNSLFDYIDYAQGGTNIGIDPKQELVQIGSGIFTPFIMSKSNNNANPGRPWFTTAYVGKQQIVSKYSGIEYLNNVDIVLTSDKTKWSRCVVVERGDRDGYFNLNPGIGQAGNFLPRDSESVDMNGNSDGTGSGMGYFPGYAIDVVTGKRLNIFFGENSSYNEGNSIEGILNGIPLGADMIFNPSGQAIIAPEFTDEVFSNFNLIAGGQHVIYVTRQEYDGCESIAEKLRKDSPNEKGKALGMITWQAVAMLNRGTELLSIEDGLIPNDVTIKMRVKSPYSKEHKVEIGNKNKCLLIEDANNPLYEFELKGVESKLLENDEYEGALANVNVVPNPYYGFSAYEFSQYATTVKITNVPDKATVTIYSLDGKFIKQFKRDEISQACGNSSNPGVALMQTNPDIEWNLKNSKGIPVSSGVYLIHVSAPELQEERTIKWFGVGRKFDPSGL